jgi:hypothetical protein
VLQLADPPSWLSLGPSSSKARLDEIAKIVRVQLLFAVRARARRGRHWWEKPLWSWFVRAIGPGCRTGINNSGPMSVPVPARTGTDRSPRGRARSKGGVDHWSRFVARTGIVDLCILGYFCTAAGFCIFFHLFIWCVLYSI